MSTKISCPYCHNGMSVKAVKVGRFKPTCAKCNEVFVLDVTNLDPPQVKALRIASGKSSGVSRETRTPPTDSTIDSNRASDKTIGHVSPSDKTVEISSPGDKTIEHAAPSDKTVEFLSPGDKTVELAVPRSKTVEHATTQAANPKQVGSKSDRTKSDNTDATIAAKNANRNSNPTIPAGETKNSLRDFSVDGTMESTPTGGKNPAPKDRKHEASIQRLGGYRVLSELGRGGMGSVYLAKQVTLDRNVALKTIQAEWASNPRVIARFIREAYAAAQLTHHNVVQIYDLGEESGTNFFSMELVGGGSLDDVLKKGKLDPKTAASFIAQAARGLKFAHDNGMVHRDIKPANLMLTNEGLVKVADLGLVKTPHAQEEELNSTEERNIMLASARSQVTDFGSTMGTPAYMSPEQADDATNVDHRADIYSLGCTFYALLTGRPPFTSNSALEIITKHKTEPLVRADRVVEGIPAVVATIVEKMTAKKPEDRYQDLSQVLEEIESFLGADNSKPFAPSVEHATLLKRSNDAFNSAPLVMLRGWIPIAFLVLVVVLSLVMVKFNLRLAASTLMLIVLTPAAIALISAFMQSESPIGSRLRANLMSSRISDWLTWSVGGILALVVFGVLGLIPYLLVSVALATGLALAYRAVFQNALAKQREAAIDRAEGLLRELRIGGLSENAIQQFVAEFSGKNWEESFETLFDYDTMRQARAALLESGKVKGKQRFRTWRDHIINRLDARLLQHKMDREHRVISKVERASLKASGLSDADAKSQAEDLAATMVTFASEARQTMAEISFNPTDQKAAAKRERIKTMLAEARSGKGKQGASFARRATATMMAHLFGSKLRFAIGGLLIAGCALWAKQNNLLDPSKIEEMRKTAAQVTSQSQDAVQSKNLDTAIDAGAKALESSTQILKDTKALTYLPAFDSFAPGVIGVLVLLSSLVYGWRYSIFAVLASGIVLWGSSFNVPSVGPVTSDWISGGIAVLILVVGLVVGRTPEKSSG